ncbi:MULTISPECIES: type II toxin-antitoxin system VapC family toxin [Rhizobiaceae]|uniref:Ribonuclease VapC n=1 Tax=Aliirhizobium cellulosilyticum TaxID=393664 RepID=A0A7W6V2X3_9HYPH|nr:tRNA(fMet)-specific endonuclease VapC [Rhizobium cellulosilyticum]MBB4413463.1 tRNA(fMet)-specific endonuclease VapC [Rhizobium cellulosilyticum]MBB4448096.1 tRNA(fMet)-specific endonuclease VapC [Rhizobium cellulosilyticum]
MTTDWRYMLDTNIASEIIRHPDGPVAQRMFNVSSLCCISSLVASELRYGAEKRASARLIDLVEALIRRLAVAPYEDVSTFHYASIRNDLTAKGALIGPVDLFIAAHARSLDLTLVTNNIREFSRVDGLRVENWLEEAAP